MMLSHDLARALLARRNNDVRIEVVIDDDPTRETYTLRSAVLRCDDSLIDADIRADASQASSLRYDTSTDQIVILAGGIVTSDPDDE